MSRRRRSSVPLPGRLVALLATASSAVAQLDVLDSSWPSTAYDIAFLSKNLQRRHSEDSIELLRRHSAAQKLLCALGVTSACDVPAPSIDTSSDPFNCAWGLSEADGTVADELWQAELSGMVALLPYRTAPVPSYAQKGHAYRVVASAAHGQVERAPASDPANCGSVGNICLVLTGAAGVSCQASACVASECLSGYRLTKGTCAAVPFASDPSNCGRAGNRCPASFANGISSMCEDGAWLPERCVDGYAWNPNTTACVLATSIFATPLRTSATSAMQTTCSPAHAAVPHSDTQSAVSTTSTTDSFPTKHTAAAASASARLRQRRASLVARIPSICPTGLTACPIPSAASFGAFQASNFTPFRSPDASSSSLDGGFECIDIQYEYESCGGCTSMGEGRNCGEGIAHARGTGCQEGRCVVFSCEKGWKPDRDAKRCVRLWEGGRKKSSGHGKGRRRLH